MNTKKIVLISGIIILVVAIVVVGFWYIQSISTVPPQGGNASSTFPVAPTSTSPAAPSPVAGSSSSVFSIPTAQGAVTVNNFYQNAVIVAAGGSEALVARNPGYDISYYQPDNSFAISISQKPVMAMRTQAEAAFLQKLGISQSDACKLKVTVGVPISVDQQYAGTDFGLSFCK
ncbi:MAG: hypothetical protein WC246_00160 [Candidatus Paceibacterota bacterium]|jgi:hypothetical protein